MVSQIQRSGEAIVHEPAKRYENAVQYINETVRQQFIQAVKDINEEFFGEYALGIHVVNRGQGGEKNRYGNGREFDVLDNYEISISSDCELDYEYLCSYDKGCVFYLGKFCAYHADKNDLQQMALQGRQPEFQDVYDYWKTRLDDDLAFYLDNPLGVKQTKEKIRVAFIKEIKKTHNSFHRNKPFELSVGTPSIISHKEPATDDERRERSRVMLGRLNEMTIEPLRVYRIWCCKNEIPRIAYSPGSVQILTDMKTFRLMVAGDQSVSVEEACDQASMHVWRTVQSYYQPLPVKAFNSLKGEVVRWWKGE